MKIFIVEDDSDIREMESYALRNSGYEVEEFADSYGFFEVIRQEVPDLIILDIMLAGSDGLSILKVLRESKRTRSVPVMMVTAKSTELDRVRGLDAGADDYLPKPFGIMEFVSRVKALLRRAAPKEFFDVIASAGIVVDDTKHSVTAGDVRCDLTYKEYELLKFFMVNKNVVLSREKLLNRVWGFEFDGETRTVDMHIKTLRQKLGEYGRHIKTVRNVGYKFED